MDETVDIAALLQHSAWLRRLAICLVRDDAAADDLVQETWVAAMARPPRAGQTVRPWLGEVLRNVMRAKFRSDTRRGRREIAAKDPHAEVARADALVERVELQRLLAGELLAIDEPYRTTLLLHFYEELAPTEIATQLSQPAGTVRWRLKAGLDQLRARFDRRHAGNRQAWLSAMMPLTLDKAPPVGVATSVLKGAFIMKIGTAAFLTVGVAITSIALLKHRTHAQPPVAQSQPVAAAPIAAPILPPLATKLTPQLTPEAAATRARMLAQIASARQAAATPHDARPLDKEYIADQIRELMPLVKECYEGALERNPDLGGKIVVRFTIVGDPSVGGLVGDSSVVDDKSTIADKELRECLAESMYAAKFPPPSAEGGDVTVEYPFTFQTVNVFKPKPGHEAQ